MRTGHRRGQIPWIAGIISQVTRQGEGDRDSIALPLIFSRLEPRMVEVVFLNIEMLREHEEIRPQYLEELKNEILSDGILKMPIAVDRTTHIILDGHHRLHALKRIGCKRIPAILVDYRSPDIEVLPWREGEMITKEMIIETALSGRRMAPKTSRHMVRVGGELKHISCLEVTINIPLEELK